MKNEENKIALFTLAVGKDPVYFNSVRRYFPYNKEYFGQNRDVDYLLFTDRTETIDGIISIPCPSSLWPYTTLLKNNIITDYLDREDRWKKYSHIFFIDADFAIGESYDFFSPEFVMVRSDSNKNNGRGFFYGGKTNYFRELCSLFFDEIRFIYENKLSLPPELDEFYLGIFLEKYKEKVHVIDMDRQSNTLIFYDNEDLDEKIRQTGKRLLMQPYKAEGRANKTFVTDLYGNRQECIVNLEELYIFNNFTFDFGRLSHIDDIHYRILWAKQPERREVLNIKTFKISKQSAGFDTVQSSPVISVVMPTYNTPLEYLKESVESVLKQTFADFELLVIDDGSTERQSIEWLKMLKDTRIKLIHNRHDFVDSLNRGIAESKGRYIARMDADDRMMPNRLQRQYNFMEEHTEIDVCGSWMELFGYNNGIEKLQTAHKEIVSALLLCNPMAHPTIMLRKPSVCRRNTCLYKKGYDCAEDYKLWTDLAAEGFRFANIPEVLLKYRCSEKQATITRQKEMIQSSLKIQMEYAEWIMEKITEKENRLFIFFDELVKLYNDGIISANALTKTVYNFFYRLFNINL